MEKKNKLDELRRRLSKEPSTELPPKEPLKIKPKPKPKKAEPSADNVNAELEAAKLKTEVDNGGKEWNLLDPETW